MKSFFIVIIILGVSIPAFAQDKFKFKSFEVYSGKNPFFSGSDFRVSFESDKKTLKIAGNETRSYTKFFWKYSSEAWKYPSESLIGITGGSFKNDPWLGPELSLNIRNVSAVFWCGWFLGENGFNKIRFFFLDGIFRLTVKDLTFGYTAQYFEEKKDHIPGISFSKNINKNFICVRGCEYSLRKKEPMFYISVRYVP